MIFAWKTAARECSWLTQFRALGGGFQADFRRLKAVQGHAMIVATIERIGRLP
jgi:hypothetical protein